VLSIERIEVSGEKKIDPTIIESYVDSQLDDGSFRYFSRRNILFYPKAVIESSIVASFPRVSGAKLSRPSLFSNELLVSIQERSPFALWCRNEADCYAMDADGFIFTTAATTTRSEFETQYVFSGDIEGDAIGERFAPGQFPSVLALLRILQQKTNLIPTRIAVLQDHDFTVEVEQGFSIKATFGQEPDTLARNLELVLSSEALRERIAEIEYVDLRFGNRVYYKMKGEEQTNI
jgi:cell division septal protein FtsQ